MNKRSSISCLLIVFVFGTIAMYHSAFARNDLPAFAGCTFVKDEVALMAATVSVGGKPEVRLRWMTKRGWTPGVTFNLYRIGPDQKATRLNTEPLGSKAGTVQLNSGNSRISPDFKYTETLNVARRPLPPQTQTVVDSTPIQRMESSQAFNAMRDTIKQLRSQQVKSPGLTARGFSEKVMQADGVRPYLETLRKGTNAAAPAQSQRVKAPELSEEEKTREARATLQFAALLHPQIARDLGYAFEDQTAQPGATYTYQLRSIENSQECDTPIATTQITVGQDQALAGVANLTAAQADEDSVDLRWTRPANEDALAPTYRITRTDAKGSRNTDRPIVIADMKLALPQSVSGRQITHVEPRSFYHDRGVAAGKVTYTVVVTDIFGRDSAPVSIDFTMEDWHTPDQVSKVWAELRGNDVRVSWTPSTDKGVVYRVYRVDAEKADAKPELLTTTAPVAGEQITIPEELKNLVTRRAAQANVPRSEPRPATARPEQGSNATLVREQQPNTARPESTATMPAAWLSYIDKNVPNDHSYRYLITAVYQNRNDMDSPASYSRVLPVPVTTLLAGPSNLKAQLSARPQSTIARKKFEILASEPRQTNYGGTIQLSWEKVAGAKLYRIYRANASGYFNPAKASTAAPTSAARVTRPGELSTTPQSKTTGPLNPNTVAGTSAGSVRKEIQFSQASLRYVTEVDEANIPDSSFALIGQVNDGTAFYDHFPRSQAHTYVYRVVAVNRWNVPAAGMTKDAKYSSAKVRVPATLPPNTPVLLSVESDKSGYLQLKIQGNLEDEGVVRYHIYRRDMPLSTAIAEVQTQSPPGNFKLNAPAITVLHPFSNAVKRETLGQARSAQIHTLFFQRDGYQELTTIKTGSGKKLDSKGQLAFSDDTVVPLHEYFYYVIADNGDVKYSSKASNILNAMPPKVRADPPASLKATMSSGGGVNLSWPTTTPDAVYIVERAKASGDHFAQLDGASAKNSYVDHSALPGHTYIYRVIAVDQSGAVSDPLAYPLDKQNKNPDAYPARLKFTVPAIKPVNTQ